MDVVSEDKILMEWSNKHTLSEVNYLAYIRRKTSSLWSLQDLLQRVHKSRIGLDATSTKAIMMEQIKHQPLA